MKASIFMLLIVALHIKQSCSARSGPNSSSKLSKHGSYRLSGEKGASSFAKSSSHRALASSLTVSNPELPEPSSSPTLAPSPTPHPTPSVSPDAVSSMLPSGPFLGYVGSENNRFKHKCLRCCKRSRDQKSKESLENGCRACWLSLSALNAPIPPSSRCQPGDSLGFARAPTPCFFQRCSLGLRRKPSRPNCHCDRSSDSIEQEEE